MRDNPFDEKTVVTQRPPDEKPANVFESHTRVVRKEIEDAPLVSPGKLRRRSSPLWFGAGVLLVLGFIGCILEWSSLRSKNETTYKAPLTIPSVPAASAPAIAAPLPPTPVAGVRRMNKGDVFQLIKENLSKNR